MKTKIIKISIAVVIIALIGFFVWKWVAGSIGTPKPTPKPENTYIKNIQHDIDSLDSFIPPNTFCHEFYKSIQYRIDDGYKHQYLGNNTNDNNRWKKTLTHNLYSAYANKFVKQAYYVFGGTDWQPDKLKFIRKEVDTLKKSSYLERHGQMDNAFANIQNILAKYYEIAGFISECKNFSDTDYRLNAEFPDVSDKIEIAEGYLSNDLDNPYVNNCTRLRDGLKQVPRTLLHEHFEYLYNKILEYHQEGFYNKYKRFNDYKEIIYLPLKNQIEALDKYEINYQNEYDSLLNLLNKYEGIAYSLLPE